MALGRPRYDSCVRGPPHRPGLDVGKFVIARHFPPHWPRELCPEGPPDAESGGPRGDHSWWSDANRHLLAACSWADWATDLTHVRLLGCPLLEGRQLAWQWVVAPPRVKSAVAERRGREVGAWFDLPRLSIGSPRSPKCGTGIGQASAPVGHVEMGPPLGGEGEGGILKRLTQKYSNWLAMDSHRSLRGFRRLRRRARPPRRRPSATRHHQRSGG